MGNPAGRPGVMRARVVAAHQADPTLTASQLGAALGIDSETASYHARRAGLHLRDGRPEGRRLGGRIVQARKHGPRGHIVPGDACGHLAACVAEAVVDGVPLDRAGAVGWRRFLARYGHRVVDDEEAAEYLATQSYREVLRRAAAARRDARRRAAAQQEG